MMRFLIALLGIGLVFVLGGVAEAQGTQPVEDPALPTQVLEAQQAWRDKFNSVIKWEGDQQQELRPEFADLKQHLRNLELMSSGLTFLGENKLKELAEVQVRLIKKYQDSPPQTVENLGMYREALLQHGSLCVDLAEPVLARQRAEQAWSIHQKLMTPAVAASDRGVRDTMATCLRLAVMWLGSDRPRNAQKYLNIAYENSEKMKVNPLRGEVFLLKSVVSNTQHAFGQASHSSAQALEIFRRQFPHGHPKIAIAQCQLATAQLGLGKLQEAKELLQNADNVLKSRPQGTKQLHAEVYRMLAQLHLEKGEDLVAFRCAARSRELYLSLFSGFPKSHPNLIAALSSLAELLNRFRQRDVNG
ncbi:MAG: hypothetical protein JWM11_8011, partial [Planctomycetaceae bacterium]|nr:hypothetical protein [Planctomycetaceae bacterium]